MVTRKVIRVPEKLYIQTLIAGGMTPTQVIEELQRLNIEVPTNEMASIVDEVREVVADLKSFDDITLDALQLSPMYYYRFQKPVPADVSIIGCEGAFAILEDPRLVKIIRALALTGINPIDIELLVNGRYQISHESPDFQTFIKYFANFEEWNYPDREFFVEQVKDAEYKITLKKAALKGDRHYLIWRLGLGNDPNMSMEQIFSDMMADSYFTFKEAIKSRPDDAHKFAQLAIKLADRLDQSDSRKKETHNLLDELKIKLIVENTTDSKDSKIADAKDVQVELPKRSTDIASINLEGLKFE
jgi:hypothetical protein